MRSRPVAVVILALAGTIATMSAAVSVPVATDHAAEAGLQPLRNNTWSSAQVDYDGDGDEDIFIGYHQAGVVKGTSGAGKIWSNDGTGHYTWVAQSAFPRVNANGLITDRHDCQFGYANNDLKLDAYCSAGRNESNRVKTGMDNELWLQNSPTSFTEVGTAWGVGDECGRGRHVSWIYANNDSYQDLILGNEVPRSDQSDRCNTDPSLPNEDTKLYLNQAGTGFREAPEMGIVGTTGAGQRCAVVLDLENDGDEDWLGCRLKGNTPLLYRNNNKTSFTQVASAWNLTRATADVATANLNGDNLPDLLLASRNAFYYQLNTGTRFANAVLISTISSGEARAIASGDADGDGDIDVYGMVASSNGNPTDHLLINTGGLQFTRYSTPTAVGEADEVFAVHPNRAAPLRTEFLSLNGGGKDGGTIQLLRVTP